MNRYPAWVYNIREDITRENMRQYDKQQEERRRKFDQVQRELYPAYYEMRGRERLEAMRDIERRLENE